MEDNNQESNEDHIYQIISKQMLYKESDRGCVLVAVPILDECLEKVLRNIFSSEKSVIKKSVNPLFTIFGPLSTFWAKIQLTNALNILPEEVYEDLEVIRDLRNKFAHQYKPVSFLDPEVINLAENLLCSKTMSKKIKRYSLKIEGSTDSELPHDPIMKEMGFVKYSKALFSYCVASIYRYLEILSLNNYGYLELLIIKKEFQKIIKA